MAQVGVSTIRRAKVVLKEGTEEEKNAVRDGSRSMRAVATEIKSRRSNSPAAAAPPPDPDPPTNANQNQAVPARNNGHGPRIKTPDDMSVSDWCRRGMEREAQGRSSEAAADELGWDPRTYRNARDICLLFDRDDLSPKDRRLVAEAYAEMNETRRNRAPYEKISHLGEMIWGRRRERGRAEKQRLDAFANALIVIEATCDRAAGLEIPHLAADAVREAQKQVDKAIANLRQLRSRLNRKEMA